MSDRKASGMLQVFVSAPGNKRPFYKRDVLNLCCTAVDHQVALAYKTEWIADEVLKRLKRDNNWLKHRPAMVIFCEDLTNQTGDVYRFHPIRRATIVRALPGETGVNFELRLREFITAEDSNTDKIHDKIKEQAEEHPNYRKSQSGVQNNKKAKFVRWVGNKSKLQVKSVGWDAFITHVSSLGGLKDTLFFALADDTGTKYPHVPPTFRRLRLGRPQECKLRRGAEAQLNLYAIPGRDKEFSPPTISVSESVLGVSGPFVRQHFNGYFVEYYLQAKSGWDKDSTMLTIALGNCHRDGFHSPEISLHVRVSPRLWMTLFVVGLLILGTALSSLDRDTLTALGASADLSLVAKAIGPILLGIGAFLGFRHLPGQ